MGVQKILFALTLLVAQLIHVYSSHATVPAFLWAHLGQGSSEDNVKEAVNYQTISPNNLAKVVLSEGGWSSFMCTGENPHSNVDVAMVFVGKELQTSDLSSNDHQDPTLINLLKQSFKSSNTSIAFPYIAVSDEEDTLENSLISGFVENCGHELEVKNIAYMGSCSLKGQAIKRIGLHSFQDFIGKKMESHVSGPTNLIVFCQETSVGSIHTESEGKILTKIVDSLEQSASTYTILYASDPFRPNLYASHLAMRYLAEDNSSFNSTHCDGLCEVKSTLLEGLFVAIVLLVVLISGLCCMMGIDTPTRFETAPDS